MLADVRGLDPPAIKLWNLEEEFPVLPLRLAQRRLRNHVDRFQAGLALVLYGTDVDADAASGAVFRRNLDGVLEGRRRALQLLWVVDLDADYGVRADDSALAALNTDLRIPCRNLEAMLR